MKCPDPILNGVIVVGVSILAFLFYMALMVLNIRKRKDSTISILLRIFTNYLQLVITSFSFELRFPDGLIRSLSPMVRVGDPQQTFLSFDCFILDTEVKGPFESNSIFKLFLLSVLPLILFIIVALIWIIVKLINKKWVPEMARNLAISFITIVFILHPTLALNSLVIFQCVEVDHDVSKVRIYTEMECYSTDHIFWCLVLGLPILLFWVIFIPVLALILLIKNFKKQEDNKVKQYFLVLYQGLKPEIYYWEFVNSFRKVSIMFTLTIFSSFGVFYKIMILVVILIITIRIQTRLQPYKDQENDEIELLAVNVGCFTIFSALIFSYDDFNLGWFNTILFVAIVAINIVFILKWFYLFVI